ncbi:hypothetical protein ACCAA_460019 [Candidatus Accumulibacter aalborgensis]|uniref:Uncharacterized protein n=1 Tax=Candidatus Accumulibacter aalborgensis TaxID=1860102 RepID=A0A1A8XUJ2_9PROT|nr:hypothetical protein ACCAA_460019 [Candidatus Accumulibacter aalborgensis]
MTGENTQKWDLRLFLHNPVRLWRIAGDARAEAKGKTGPRRRGTRPPRCWSSHDCLSPR